MLQGIESPTKEFKGSLQESYLGYCVIRPMPTNFLGRICLRPYKALLEDASQFKIIKNQEEVSFFGIALTVEAAALREQDKVVSACATSAVWSLLNGYGHLSSHEIPSLSTITKVATNPDIHGSRTFPSTGLMPDQIARSLKHFSLEPHSKRIDYFGPADRLLQLKHYVHAHVSNDVPLLLGGMVYSDCSPDTEPGTVFKREGMHLVCVLGFRRNPGYDFELDQDCSVGPFLNQADSLNRLYVHDDRYGPYMSIRIDSPLEILDLPAQQHQLAYEISKPSVGTKEYFVPYILTFGLYHKIRLSLEDITKVCTTLHRFFEASIEVPSAIQNEVETIQHNIKEVLEGVWSITLTTGAKLKDDISQLTTPWMSSKGFQKVDFLTSNMPKYLWLCRVTRRDNGDRLTDIIFDATEILQGDIFRGFVAYESTIIDFWDAIEEHIESGVWRKMSDGDPEARDFIASVEHFFEAETYKLDLQFGQARPARRSLKPGEYNKFLKTTLQDSLIVVTSYQQGNWAGQTLDEKKVYIWVIDEHGHLIIGEDKHKKDEHGEVIFEGHPTLTRGRKARVGGELQFGRCPDDSDSKVDYWWINSKSGTYSKHLLSEKDRQGVLKTVMDRRFNNFPHGSIRYSALIV